MDYNPITEGLLKAMRFIAESNARNNSNAKKKYDFESAGTMVHGRRCLKQSERKAINAFLEQYGNEVEDAKRQAILKELFSSMPVKGVPVKRAILIDRSRYTGADLRAIRADGGGAKEKARAAKRAQPQLLAAQ